MPQPIRRKMALLLVLVLSFLLLSTGCGDGLPSAEPEQSSAEGIVQTGEQTGEPSKTAFSLSATSSSVSVTVSSRSNSAVGDPSPSVTTAESVPAYAGQPYVAVRRNQPTFTAEEQRAVSFERYAALDAKGRCGTAYACIGRDLMPTEDRTSIGQIKPSGWQTVKYDSVDGKYLYNRCHLIGFQLSGENANRQNLITGTRYLNVEGMLPFENMVADYVKETGNHVLYRVTPRFENEELVARGVFIEAFSVEDAGEGICFYVYCYNVQPGIVIDYATGESRRETDSALSRKTTVTEKTSASSTAATVKTTAKQTTAEFQEMHYVVNIHTGKFHNFSCSYVDRIKKENREDYTGNRQSLLNRGYSPCGHCKP